MDNAFSYTEVSEKYWVSKLEVSIQNSPMDSPINSQIILEKVRTKVGDPFSQILFDADLKFLSTEYDRVEPEIIIQGSQLLITIKLWMRPKIAKIKFEGNHHFKSAVLLKELDVKEEKIFNRSEFNNNFKKLKDFYIKKGYFESEIDYSIEQISGSNDINISINIVEGRGGLVKELLFEGFNEEEKEVLLDTISTKKKGLFSWLTGGGVFNEEVIETDRLAVLNFFRNCGYADATLQIRIIESDEVGKIVLLFSLNRGLLFHFGKISFSGNNFFSNEEIEQLFLIHSGEVYSLEKLQKTVEAIRDAYGKKGHIDSQVEYEALLAADLPSYDVHFQIEEGVQYKIGLIHVFGNEQTETKVILRESLLVPGDTFNSIKLKYTQQRLQNVGFFKNVNVYAVRVPEEEQIDGDAYRDVYIEVEEAPTGHGSLFMGVGSGGGVFGGIDFTETNFNFRGIGNFPDRGFSALRGGGEYAYARAAIGTRQTAYTLSWMDPYFKDSLWRVGIEGNIGQSSLQTKNYQVLSGGGILSASYPLSPYWTLGSRYRFKHATIKVSSDATPQEKEAAQGSGNTSAASVFFNYDSTDSISRPHNGFISSTELEYAGIGGKFSFLKCNYLNNFYQQLWKKGMIRYRWEFRFIYPMLWTSNPQDIPLSERFFIGGENSVRGYKPFDLGPHYPNGDPRGGISSSVLSLEYVHEILSILDSFLFVDAGSISMKPFKLPEYQLSYGIGCRIYMMKVPITFGMGFPVNPTSKDQVERFFFSMGGQF